MKEKRGLSLNIVIGTYGGFNFQFSKTAIRICLGFIAIAIYFLDIENVMEETFDVITRLKKLEKIYFSMMNRARNNKGHEALFLFEVKKNKNKETLIIKEYSNKRSKK